MESAMILCPTCGAEFPAGARFCPKCGYVVPPTATTPEPSVLIVEQPAAAPPSVVYVDKPAEPTNWTPWIAGIVIALLAATGIALWNMGYLSGGESTTTVIETPATPDQAPPPTININTPPDAPDINITTPPDAPDIIVTPPAEKPEPGPAPEIVSVSGKVLDDTGSEWEYGYELKLRNTSPVDKTVSLKVSFLDGSGFVVDDALTEKYVIPANSEKSFAGADMVPASKAGTIETVKAEFR
jgi:hypothetical protein